MLGVSRAHVRRLAAPGALACEETPLGRLYRRADLERRRADPPRRCPTSTKAESHPRASPEPEPPALVEVRLTKRVRFAGGVVAVPGQVVSYTRPADAQALIDAGVGEPVVASLR